MKKIWTILAAVMICAVAFAQEGRTIHEIKVRGNEQTNDVIIMSAIGLKVGDKYTEAASEAAKNAIYDLGWYRKVDIYTNPSGDTDVDVLIDVAEYPVIREIRVDGNTVFPDEKIIEIIKQYQEVGKIWNNKNGPKIVKDVRQLYSDKGFFAEFEDLSPLEDSPGTLNAKILEAKLGTIEFKGLHRTKERTIKRVIKSEPGKAFNLQKFRDDMGELQQRRWFESIDPKRVEGGPPDVFNFIIDVKEAQTAQLNAGIAVDAQGRLVGTASYSDSNFMGNGQNVGLQLNQATSGGGPSASLAFTNPFYDAMDTVFTARVFSEVIYNFNGGLFGQSSSDNQNQFNERRTGAQVQFVRPVSEYNRVTLGATFRRAQTIDLTTTGAENYIQQDGDLATLQLGYEFNSARPSIEPVRGEAVSLLLEPGYSDITKIGGNVGSNTDLLGSSTFLRSSLEFRKYWSKEPKADPNAEVDAKFKPRPVVAFRMRYGYLTGKVPFFEQLFLGGQNSLRGYSNQRFWGNQSLLTTLEYRHPITDNFTLIGFGDYGSAWGGYGQLSGFEQTSHPDFHLGYGLGVAFRTPLGPIRIDFAFNDQGGSRTHFTFGTAF